MISRGRWFRARMTIRERQTWLALSAAGRTCAPKPPAKAFGQADGGPDPRPHAVTADEHDDHQHQADPELPVLRRDIGEPVLHRPEDDRADQPAVEIADPTDD